MFAKHICYNFHSTMYCPTLFWMKLYFSKVEIILAKPTFGDNGWNQLSLAAEDTLTFKINYDKFVKTRK